MTKTVEERTPKMRTRWSQSLALRQLLGKHGQQSPTLQGKTREWHLVQQAPWQRHRSGCPKDEADKEVCSAARELPSSAIGNAPAGG
mmetsp:Transcript_8068/g.19237  ORF Transcript_8068/g.19237 Transcript_8068/m.19237 type:complete len:87 (-) Transcript_8068:46-306(-)